MTATPLVSRAIVRVGTKDGLRWGLEQRMDLKKEERPPGDDLSPGLPTPNSEEATFFGVERQRIRHKSAGMAQLGAMRGNPRTGGSAIVRRYIDANVAAVVI